MGGLDKMSDLCRIFRETVQSYKELAMKTEKEADVGYSTGFPNFDMRNAAEVHVYNEEKGLNYKYYMVGLSDGCITTIIGRSGCGKSTWAWQVAANIVRPFKEGSIFADEIESGMQDSRKETLTGFNGAELKERCIVRNTGITSQNFFQRIKLIHDIRVADPDRYMYDTGYLDYNGNPISKFVPCVYILDSYALLRPAELTKEEELSGQMSVTSSAKMNTEILRRITPLIKEANINLFIINHILQDVQINAFKPKQQQNRYLKEGERCPGGDTALYLANNLIKLVDLQLDKGYDMDGSKIRLEILKSRTNKAGKYTFLVYDQATGYDPELSLFESLKEDGVICAAGAYYSFKDHPEVTKFKRKEFKEKIRTDADFRQKFMAAAMEYLASMVDKEAQEERESVQQTISITNEFYNMINYQGAKVA